MSAKCVGSTEHDIEKPKQKLTVAKKKKKNDYQITTVRQTMQDDDKLDAAR